MQRKVKTDYKTVRGKLILKGTSLRRWALDRGYSYRTVISAAKGIRHGKTSKKIRRELEALIHG